MSKTIALSGLIFFFSLGLYAQQPEAIRFYTLDAGNGWNNSTVAYVYQDSRGFVWLGSSEEGLGRFDAQQIRSYQHSDTDSSSLADNNIQSDFFEDGEGNLWFSTYTALHCYDRRRDAFRRFRLTNPQGHEILTDYRVVHLQADGLLWLRAGEGLFTFNIKTGRQVAYLHPFPYVRFSVLCDSMGQVQRITAARWMLGPGLASFDYEEGHLRAEASFGLEEDLVVNCISPESDSAVWCSSGKKGLVLYNLYKNQVVVNCTSWQGEDFICRFVLPYNNRFLLLATLEHGILLFDKTSGTVVHQWKAEPGQPHRLASDNIYALMLDGQQNLWACTQNRGVSFGSAIQQKFAFTSIDPELRSEITAIAHNSKGQLLAGTLEKGLMLTEDTENASWRAHPSNAFLPNKKIEALYQDTASGLWVLTRAGLVLLPDPVGLPQLVQGFEGYPMAFLRLRSGRRILCASRGIYDIVLENNQFVARVASDFDQQISSNIIAETASGAVLFCDNSNKIKQYQPASAQTYSLQFEAAYGGRIYNFFQASDDGRLYVCGVNGAFVWNSNTGQLGTDDLCRQLGKQAVYQMQADGNGGLWISAGRGLYRLQDEKLSCYTEEDGLPQRSSKHLFKTRSGTFYLGGHIGSARFVPEAISDNNFYPKVALTGLEVNYQHFPLRDATSIELAYTQNNLTFSFAALAYGAPEENRFLYQLQGYDAQWIESSEGTVHYSRLPPGRYTLLIKAANSDQVWSPEPLRFQIHIRPPFWQTWPFILVASLVLIGGIVLATRLYFRQKLAAQQRELERQTMLRNERNRIAAELHDELGQGLSRIKFISEAAKNWELQAENRKKLDKIWASSVQLMENMGDIIWAMDSDNDSLENLLQTIRRYTQEVLNEYDIVPHFNFPEQASGLEISGGKRRNLLLIVKECLHNIIKHSGARQVWIQVAIHPQTHLFIQIADDGQGLPEQLRAGGNGLKNMRKKAAAMNASIEFSNTEPGLAVALNIKL